MSEFGLTATGFLRKRLEEIKASIEADAITLLGPLNLTADSVLGQLIGVLSKGYSDIWQLDEAVYYSMYPSTAEGSSLDNAVDLIAIRRLAATHTTVTVMATGNEAVAIPAGSLVKVTETGEQFTNAVAGVITQANALKAVFSVTTVTNEFDYIVTLNSVNYTYTSDTDATAIEIAAGLVSEINDTDDPVTATAIGDGTFTLTSDDSETTFNTYPGTSLSITSRGSPVVFDAVNTGPVLALADTVNAIVTPVSGWLSVTNLLEGDIGRNTETDQELRLRRLTSLRVLGAASAEAIQARLRQDVDGVTAALVFENRLPTTDGDNRPPHSFESVVVGGDDQEIARKLWDIKAAGIQTYGNVTELVVDSNGFEQEIKFSRPVDVFIWMTCEITPIEGETIPDDVLEDITAALLAKGQTLTIGEDVIYQQFFAPVFTIAAQYIASIVIELATSATEEGPAGAYSAANVEIGQVEIANFGLERIEVTEV